MVRDPILLEIVKNAFATAAEEMGLAVVRSAYSTIVKEGGDASSAIFDRDGRLIAQSRGAPLYHLCSLRPTLWEVMKDFPPDTMNDGDVFACNDPYRGGIHSNDVMVFKPVFARGRIVAYTGVLIHVADLGGISAGGLPATATEMYHEGLVLPPVKLFDGGKPDDAVMKVIPANSRTPEKVMGDIRALVAADNVGAARLLALGKKYGFDELHAITSELLDYAERRTRQEIQKIPPGRYEGSFIIDDDGVENRLEGYAVRCSIGVEGSSFRADFTGTDKQAQGPINAAASQSMGGILFALRCFIDPTIPINEGCYRPLDILLPHGTLVNPRPPAACNARMATVVAIVEAMFQAFSKAYPQKAMAASGNIHVYTMNGLDGGTGRVWTYMDGNHGGLGARLGKDGIDLGGPMISGGGGGGGQAIEAYEMEYPVLFRRFELRRDSGGPGQWRGGLGLRREVKILESGAVTVRATDRCRFPPPGVFGGVQGLGGGWVVNMDAPNERHLPTKASGVPLAPGDSLTMLSSGGGGFGNPLRRDPRLILDDVLEQKVTLDGARRDYGVVIDSGTLDVDDEATQRRRAESSQDGEGQTVQYVKRHHERNITTGAVTTPLPG